MIRTSIRAAFLVVAAVAVAAAGVPAQQQTTAPIKVKVPKPKLKKFKGEVLHANMIQIIVRSAENEKVIRTFTYTPEVKEKMMKIIDRGGYQVGDKVEIHHEAGSNVAVKIKGKPSKPL